MNRYLNHAEWFLIVGDVVILAIAIPLCWIAGIRGPLLFTVPLWPVIVWHLVLTFVNINIASRD